VTVCTNHVADGHLVEHRLPVIVAQAGGDVEVLVPEMVELEHKRIGFAAVSTRTLAEKLDEIGSVRSAIRACLRCPAFAI
jgi:hypothetical protein